MKKYVRLVAAALVAVMLLVTLAACGSTFGKIKKNFEKNGYEYVTDEDGNGLFDAVTAELEEGDISAQFHLFKGKTDEDAGWLGNLTSALDFCGVIEFGSDEDMEKALSESETLKGVVKDAQKSDYINGNCVLFPGIANIDKKVEIFKK